MSGLNETKIRTAKAREKAYKLFDERGLFLLVAPTGGRLWRFRYSVAGREKLISLGNYPDVSLKQARDRRDDARKLVANGVDPSAKRKAEKEAGAETFEAIALEWLGKQSFRPATLEKAQWTFNDLLFPYIGSRPIHAITSPEMLAVLRRLEARDKLETATRTKQRASQVFRFAIATGRAENDPTVSLKGALKTGRTKHHAGLTKPADVGGLLRSIDSYSGQPATEVAFKLAPMLFVRPIELRKAEWSEFDLESDEPTWRIPAARMKMARAHTVPLPTQAVELLTELKKLTGDETHVFPKLGNNKEAMSEAAITAALRRIGYTREQQTWHGFRTTASTLLNERGVDPDLIELQLAHKPKNEVRASYNRAERLADRRKMMQDWADYLDGLKAGGQVINIRAGIKR